MGDFRISYKGPVHEFELQVPVGELTLGPGGLTLNGVPFKPKEVKTEEKSGMFAKKLNNEKADDNGFFKKAGVGVTSAVLLVGSMVMAAIQD